MLVEGGFEQITKPSLQNNVSLGFLEVTRSVMVIFLKVEKKFTSIGSYPQEEKNHEH